MMRFLCFLALAADAGAALLRTASFTEFWESHGNEENRFYDPRTFGMNIYLDPCQRTANPHFRTFVNANVECKGLWCIDEAFKCPSGDSRFCYNVEHIIDTNGGEFLPNQTNIAGNLVMAWGRWNQELGTLARKSYADAQGEKSLVYGSDAVIRAKSWIRKCNNINSGDPENPLVFLLVMILGACLGGLTGVCMAVRVAEYVSRKKARTAPSTSVSAPDGVYIRLEPIPS